MRLDSKLLFPLLVIGCSLVIQDISSRLYHQFDLTKKGLYSLSESTGNILKKFGSDPVTAKLFLDEGDADWPQAERLIRLYQKFLPTLRYEFVSPTKHPLQVQEYGIDRNGTVVWEWRGKRIKTTGFTEDRFTSGLRRLVDPRIYPCYVLKGHGEKDPEKDFPFLTQRLEEENYSLRMLHLEEVGEVPGDAELIFWIGPKEPLLEREEALLQHYLSSGGRMVICLDPLVPVASTSKPLFTSMLGIVIGSDVVVDKRSQLFRGDFFFATATRYFAHAITRGLNKVSVFPLARSFFLSPNPQKVELFPLAETSETAWAETNRESLMKESPQFDPVLDRKGPLILAVAGELKGEDRTLTYRTGRFVLFGDSDFITDQYVKIGDNLDLFLNAVAWAVEREDGIAQRPKDPLHHPIILSRTETFLLGISVMGILPGICLLLGLYQWRKRSNAISNS
ncbi:MAG: GldG family protein [Spirochaetes bacterium]|nr:GldG family protein [Spirochaetota bacterium]